MFGFGRGTQVAQADVEFVAQTGQFEIDTKQAQRIYHNAVSEMSDDALRMSVAQEKLDRAIARFGPTSLQARTAAMNYRSELRKTQEQQDHLRNSAHRGSTEITRGARGAIAASGAFKGLGNALFFAGNAFAGAFGLVYAIRSVIQAAGKLQAAQEIMRKSTENAGISWQAEGAHIDKTLQSMINVTAFSREDLDRSFAATIARTKDSASAFDLLSTAADLARARHKSLEVATIAMLRAANGQTAGLLRMGIAVGKVTTEQDKLRQSGVKVTAQQRADAKAADAAATRLAVVAKVRAVVHGQALAFSKTEQGAQERFNAILEETKATIGEALLPTITRLLDHFSTWLDKLNRSGQLQKDVNKDIHDAGVFFHALEGAIRDAEKVLGPLVQTMGGFHNAVKFILLGTLAYKALKAAQAIKGIATAFNLVGTSAVVNSEKAVIAENEVGDAAVANTAKVEGLAKGFTTRGGMVVSGAALAGALAVGDTVSAPMEAGQQDLHNYPELYKIFQKIKNGQPLTTDERQAWAIAIRGNVVSMNGRTNASASQLKRAEGMLKIARPKDMATPHGSAAAIRAAKAAAAATAGDGGGTQPPPKRSVIDIQLDYQAAQRRKDEAGMLKYDRELKAYYERQLASLQARKKQTLLVKEQEQKVGDEIQGVQSDIDSIVSGQQTAARAKRQAEAAAAAKAHARHKQALETQEQKLLNAALRAAATQGRKDDEETTKVLIAFYKKAAHDAELTAKERAQYEHKRLEVRKKLIAARSAAELQRLDLRERRLRNAADLAELKGTMASEKKALNALIAFYKEEERNVDLSEKARQEARRKEIEARKRLKRDLKKDAKDKGGDKVTAAQISSMLQDLQASFYGQYASNIFPPNPTTSASNVGQNNVTVHVHTNAPATQDRHREIMYARRAVGAAFD